MGVQIVGTQILICWPIFLFFHVDMKAIKAFDQVKKGLSCLSITGFAESRVQVDAVVSVKW